jgi:hypothetical protein
MKNAASLLIVLGVLIGPAYYYFCEALSGRTAETHALTERASRWELPDGTILRLRSGLAYKPVPLDLDPEMNSYRLRLTFDIAQTGDVPIAARNNYQLSLLEGDTAVLQRSIEVDGGGEATRVLDVFDVFYAGRYVLLLEEIGTPPLEARGVSVELLNRVEKPRMWIAWSGVVLLGFGLALAVREALRKPLIR